MKKYSLYLVTVIFLIAGIASCKKDTNAPVIPVEVNQPPVARAGADTTFTLSSCRAKIFVPLDGTKSSDPENMITSSSWRLIPGQRDFIIRNSNSLYAGVEIRGAGVYNFELQIVDNGNLISKDTVTITIIAPSPKEYDLDITSNTTYLFRDNYEDCFGTECDYYDFTEIRGNGTFVPIGEFKIYLDEYTDTAAFHYADFSDLRVYNSDTTYIYASASINFKKLIQQGGGAFTGNFNITDGSAKYCDENIYNSLAPLLVTGSLDTATKKVSIRIKGKTFF